MLGYIYIYLRIVSRTVGPTFEKKLYYTNYITLLNREFLTIFHESSLFLKSYVLMKKVITKSMSNF